jgi:hypothetical protein
MAFGNPDSHTQVISVLIILFSPQSKKTGEIKNQGRQRVYVVDVEKSKVL